MPKYSRGDPPQRLPFCFGSQNSRLCLFTPYNLYRRSLKHMSWIPVDLSRSPSLSNGYDHRAAASLEGSAAARPKVEMCNAAI